MKLEELNREQINTLLTQVEDADENGVVKIYSIDNTTPEYEMKITEDKKVKNLFKITKEGKKKELAIKES